MQDGVPRPRLGFPSQQRRRCDDPKENEQIPLVHNLHIRSVDKLRVGYGALTCDVGAAGG